MIEFEGQVEDDEKVVELLYVSSFSVRVYKRALRECIQPRASGFVIEAEALIRLVAQGPDAAIPILCSGKAPLHSHKNLWRFCPAESARVSVDYRTPEGLILRRSITVPSILITEQPNGTMTIPRVLAEKRVAGKRSHGVTTDLVALGGVFPESDRLHACLARLA